MVLTSTISCFPALVYATRLPPCLAQKELALGCDMGAVTYMKHCSLLASQKKESLALGAPAA
jgi:hypothetical protein